MSMLKIDELTGDLAIESNKFVLIDGRQEIRQRLIHNLKTFLGEWFLDTTLGVPYFQIVFVKGASPALIADVLKSAILSTVGVTTLTRFEPLDLQPNRALIVDFSVKTTQGTIDIQEAIP